MTRRRSHPRLVRHALAAAVVLALVLPARAAYAWYSASGSTGAGAVAIGSAAGLTATSTPVASGLRPGGSAGLALELANPNSYAVRVSAIALDTSRGAGGFSWSAPGCANPRLSFATRTNGGSGWTVPARTASGDGRLAISLPGAVAMGADADSACQAATFSVSLAAS